MRNHTLGLWAMVRVRAKSSSTVSTNRGCMIYDLSIGKMHPFALVSRACACSPQALWVRVAPACQTVLPGPCAGAYMRVLNGLNEGVESNRMGSHCVSFQWLSRRVYDEE